MADRVLLGRRGQSSMVKVQWTDACPDNLNDAETAEEVGAKWEGDELVTYDFPGMVELLEYYEKNEYLPDND